MKKIFTTIALSAMLVSSLMAQTKIDEKMTVYQLPNSKLHIYQTSDAKGDMSFTIEGDEELLILEQPLFWDNIEEFNTYIESLLAKCKDSDAFASQLITAYPTLGGVENVKAIAKALYPDEVADATKEEVRARVQDYFDMVSNLDADIAKGLWAESDNVSIITPRSQFVGVDAIMNDFLLKTFSSMKSRKLHSLSEVINVYGDSANVQLYWIFDTVDAKGEAHQTRGRESLVFSKIDDKWRLVHVHYSRMPQ